MTRTGTLQVTAPGERNIAMTRVFDAPRTLVFEALTTPELLKRWLLGPPGWSMPVCEVDFKVGGAFRYVWRNESDGTEMGMSGVYREIASPERIVHEESFDQAWYPGGALVTTTLTERGGKTTMVVNIQYDSREARDVVLQSPMAGGAEQSYDRLASLLAG
jgi:uncharacterized protein YndB with AHSA1/START domain